MSLIVKQKFVCEDILDEKGNKLGEIKFNPDDTRIVSKLTKIIKNLTEGKKKIDEFGEMPDLTDKRLDTLEDFENAEKDIQRICDGFELETSAIESVFNDLYDVFGKETIDIITLGTQDIELLTPLIELIMPYVGKARELKVKKYLKQEDIEVLD